DSVYYSQIGNLTVDGGIGGNEFDLSPLAMNLDDLPSNVTLNGGTSSDTAIFDDQNNSMFSTWGVTGSSVDRSYTRFLGSLHVPVTITSTIHYNQLASLVLNGGTGGSEFDLSPNAHNLDELPASVTVHGGGSVDTLNVFDES